MNNGPIYLSNHVLMMMLIISASLVIMLGGIQDFLFALQVIFQLFPMLFYFILTLLSFGFDILGSEIVSLNGLNMTLFWGKQLEIESIILFLLYIGVFFLDNDNMALACFIDKSFIFLDNDFLKKEDANLLIALKCTCTKTKYF